MVVGAEMSYVKVMVDAIHSGSLSVAKGNSVSMRFCSLHVRRRRGNGEEKEVREKGREREGQNQRQSFQKLI